MFSISGQKKVNPAYVAVPIDHSRRFQQHLGKNKMMAPLHNPPRTVIHWGCLGFSTITGGVSNATICLDSLAAEVITYVMRKDNFSSQIVVHFELNLQLPIGRYTRIIRDFCAKLLTDWCKGKTPSVKPENLTVDIYSRHETYSHVRLNSVLA